MAVLKRGIRNKKAGKLLTYLSSTTTLLLLVVVIYCSKQDMDDPSVLQATQHAKVMLQSKTETHYPVAISGKTYFTPCTVQVNYGNYCTCEPAISWPPDSLKDSTSSNTEYRFSSWLSDTQQSIAKTILVHGDTSLIFGTTKWYKVSISLPVGNHLQKASSSLYNWYLQDSTVQLDAPHFSGDQFAYWVINDSTTIPDTFLSVRVLSPLSISGLYIRQYAIKITSNINAPINMIIGDTLAILPDSLIKNDGSILSLEAKTPIYFDTSEITQGNDVRYDFDHWANDGKTGTKRVDTIHSDVNYVASYRKSFSFEINNYPTSLSDLNINKWLPADTIVQLTPLTLPNNSFNHWVINGSTIVQSPQMYIHIDGPKNISAIYGQLVQLTVSTIPNNQQVTVFIGDSSFVSSGSIVVPKGTKVQFGVPTPQLFSTISSSDSNSARYRFLKWDNLPDISNAIMKEIDSSVAYNAVMKKEYRVEGISLLRDSAADTTIRFYAADTTIKVVRKAVNSFLFDHWNINGKAASSDTSISVAVDKPQTIIAVYGKANSISIISVPDDSAPVLVRGVQRYTPIDLEISSNDSIRVSVCSQLYRDINQSVPGPDVRYTFSKWDLANNVDTTIYLTSSSKPIAQFSMHQEFLVQTSTIPLNLGMILGSGWHTKDTSITLVAPNMPGYFFSYWKLGENDSVSSDTLTVAITAPMNIVAIYRAQYNSGDMRALLSSMKPILGSDGPKVLDGIVAHFTSDCTPYGSASEIQASAESIRQKMISTMEIDLNKSALSFELQQTHVHSDYSIEVIKLEVFKGLFAPVNVYLPAGKQSHQSPLVIMVPGCGSDLSTEYMQDLAGNLAKMGMVVLSLDGFCDNGNRALYGDANMYIGYNRELIGLQSSVTVNLQELISAISWAIQRYSTIDPTRIGCAGYSHGGCMCLGLSEIDKRVSCTSVPATGFGNSCGNMQITSDIWIETDPLYGPTTVWSAPIETPVLPINFEVSLVFPNYLQTTCGYLDPGANPAQMGPVMNYAKQIYATSGLGERVMYLTDSTIHEYGLDKRQETYGWLNYCFNGIPFQSDSEAIIEQHAYNELEPSIAGTTTLTQVLIDQINLLKAQRFSGNTPTSGVGSRTTLSMTQLFGDFTPDNLSSQSIAIQKWKGLQVNQYRVNGPFYSLPVYVFQNTEIHDGSQALYLPLTGVADEEDSIGALLNQYNTVVAIDYFGIGELKSDRVMLMTFANYFMNNNPSLPKMIINSLRSYLKSTNGKFDIIANGWASSMYSACLKFLEPSKTGKTRQSGVPADELGFLASGQQVPNLLLWNGLFSKITVAEINQTNNANNP
jgi:hypothetical protein